MRKNKILSVIGGLAAFIFTSCDGIFDVDYYTFLPEDYIFTNESTIEEGLLGCYELLYPNSFGGSSWGGTSSYDACELTYFRCTSFRMGF